MEPTGANDAALTQPGAGLSPRWAPDGRRLAFVEDADIWIMQADGSSPINLTNDPSLDRWPTWSPDGEWIAFTSNRSGVSEIYAMRPDGRDLMQLTEGESRSLSEPGWGR